MGDTGSEGSKLPGKVNVLPPRCPCGFWGHTETLSYQFLTDTQKKQPNDDCIPKATSSTSSSQPDVFCNETNSTISQSLTTPNTSEDPLPGDTGATSVPVQEASESENDASPEKRARMIEVSEGEESSSSSVSRSRKRCHRCQTKLELVQQELGSCRCGYVFCMLHRLPEQHDCLFDHLGRGRQEAVLKMVKLDRKVGRSCQRIGEECS
uniref:Zinc finger, AN1-type domain 3 n=1 Tax=Oryzias latipes TaxID=8090 RepID=A0A3P9IPS5_ORYLA